MANWFKMVAAFFGLLYLLSVMGFMGGRSLPPGVLAPIAPEQIDIDPEDAQVWRKDDFLFKPLAEFSLTARVLGAERYRFDSSAELSPVDLALGWGPMSDSDVLKDISISQSGRFYYWRTSTFPIEAGEIIRHSANMHLIPSSDSVRKKLLNVRDNELVRLSGLLVEINRGDGFHWKSSTTREDSGAGACEVIWVESIQRVRP
jgi:hypothetical protein